MWKGKSEPQIDADERITQNERSADRQSAKSNHQCGSAVQTIERVGADEMITQREEILRISQFVISLKYSKAVYVFTEQGVAMLSSVLNSTRAIQMNIAIMRIYKLGVIYVS